MTTTQIAVPTALPLRRRARSSSPTRTLLVLLAAFLLILYGCFPTQNHYWDGIGFALNIEGIGADGDQVIHNEVQFRGISSIYFNPNHLFHNLIGYLLYRPLHAVLPALRALHMLRAINTILSVAAACLMFLSLHRWSRNLRLSIWLTLLMALSATWWKFSTDAGAYVPSTFLLVLGTFVISNPKQRPVGWKIGILHALSMLLHQISFFFWPAAVVALWTHPYWRERSGRRRVVLEYLFAAAIPVAAAYLWVWVGLYHGSGSNRQFLSWLTSNGSDTFAFRSVGANILESFRSTFRVFFGGRVGLALTFVELPLLVLLVSVMGVSLARFLAGVIQHLKLRRPAESHRRDMSGLPSVRFLGTWAAVFTAFLLVWLTEYPYYRIFYMPAMIFGIGALLLRHGEGNRVTSLLAPFVVFMATFNFGMYIYPYSQKDATPQIRLAHSAREIWNDDVVVLYKDFTCDNWMMRYFNPRTIWIKADLTDRETLSRNIKRSRSNGQKIWVDTTILGQLNIMPNEREWFQQHGKLSQPWGLLNEKHRIQFAQVLMP